MRKCIKKSLAVLLSVLLLITPLTGVVSATGTSFELTLIYTDAAGTQHTSVDSLTAGTSLSLPTYKADAGQVFSGWFEDNTLQVPAPAVMPANDITLYAEMQWIDYTVTYTLNREEFATQTYHYGDLLVFPELTVETGYTFTGWSDAQGKVYSETDIVVGNLALSGVVTQNDYTLTYIVNGASYKTESKHYNDLLQYFEYPVETGYSFSGWFADAACTQAAPATMPDSDLTVYGKYTHNLYTVSYFVDGVDTGLRQSDYHYGDTIVPLTNYDETVGMTFSGWYLDADLTVPVPETMPAEDLVFYGRLTPVQYVLTYYLNGQYHSAQTYEYNQPIDYLDYKAQEGYTFSGWLLPDGEYAPLRMPAGNVTVYGTVTKVSVAKLDGGAYDNITVGDSVDVFVSLDAPYLTSLTVSDIVFDEDVFMLDSIQWLCDGKTAVDLGNRIASVSFDANSNLNGQVLKLTFVVLGNAQVGMQEIAFAAKATTNMGVGNVDLKTAVTAARVQIICASHDFAGGMVVANKNNTHSLYCANGCGVSIHQSCDGGTATCLQKAVCSVCSAEYGQKKNHDYSGEPKGNGDRTHSYRCVSGCSAYSTQKINCSYGVALNNNDNTSHKISCTVCGESVNENCYGGTVTCLTVAECERCGVNYGTVLPHSYTGNVKNNYDGTHVFLCVNGCDEYGGLAECNYGYVNKTDGVHTKTCTICSYTIDEYCAGGYATCLSPAVCLYCETTYGVALEHSFTGEARANEDGTHALQCVNGCDAFGEAVECTPDAFVGNGDGTHTAECTVCKASLHGNCKGGIATCEQYAVCEICGGAHGELLSHDYSGAYAPDENGQHGKLCLNGCNKPGGEKEDCTYGVWVGDGVAAHTRTCEVCSGTVSEECSGGTATCTEKAICSVCEAAYGDFLPHTFPVGAQGFAESKNDGTHTRYCTSCEQNVVLACEYEYIPNQDGTHIATCTLCSYTEQAQPCFGGSATCVVPASCEGCKVAYGDPLRHDYSGEAKDNGDGTHCLQCVNGCEQFGGDKIACEADEWIFNGNDTHSASCLVCKAILTDHCKGGTPTCEKQAVCEICNSSYGKGGDHSFQTAYDDTHHWGACTGCDKTTPKDEHTFTPWTIVTEMTPDHAGLRRRICTGCGTVFTEVIPRVFAKGDIDFDGQFTANDARTVLRASAGLETLSDAAKAAADVEKDDAVTAGDARLILRAAAGLEDTSSWGNIGIDDNGNIV